MFTMATQVIGSLDSCITTLLRLLHRGSYALMTSQYNEYPRHQDCLPMQMKQFRVCPALHCRRTTPRFQLGVPLCTIPLLTALRVFLERDFWTYKKTPARRNDSQVFFV